MYNKVILVGNLTRDIELRYSGGGLAIAKSAIATSRKFTSNGEKKEEVTFIDITFFGRSGEVANQFLRKGSKVLIEGRLQFDQWTDQNGAKKSKHSIAVETMQMLGEKQASQGAQAPRQSQPNPNYTQPRQDQRSANANDQAGRNNQAHQQHQQQQQAPSMDQQLPSINIDEDEIPF